ncbi:SpdA protein, partial [Streptomyces anthocyanicus]|nr:SpdA protein [Streptomyces anthocyanicus]
LEHPPALLRLGVAGWPALAFLGGTLLAHSPTSHTSTPDTPPASAPAPAPEVKPEPAPAAAPDPAPVDTADDAPALPPADPAPATPPAVAVPAALVDHARKVAADHEHRTGARIDTDTLRARLGVPAPMADAIAAQLT